MKRNLKFCIVALGVLGLTTSCTIQDVASQAVEYLQDNVNLSSYSAATSLNFISTLKAESTTEVEAGITAEESQDISDLLTQFDLILSNGSDFNVVTSDSDRADYTTKEVISFTDVNGEIISYDLYYSNIETTTSTTVTDTENDWDYFEDFGKGNQEGNGQQGQPDEGDDDEENGDRDRDRDREGEEEGEGDKDRDREGEETEGHSGEGRGGDRTGEGEGRGGETTGGRGDQTGEGQEEFDIDDFDVNGDGEITVADIVAQYDTNEDGVLDYTDFTNFLEENEMEAPDINEDGVADEADFIALFDFNEDGVVDEADIIAAFDVNGDGEFTEDDILEAGPRGDGDRQGDGECDVPEEGVPEEGEPEEGEPEEGETLEVRADGFRQVFNASEEGSEVTSGATSEEEAPVEDETSEETSEDEISSEETVVEDSEEEVSVNIVTDTTTLTTIEGIAVVGEEEYPFYSHDYTEVNSDGSTLLKNNFVAVLDQDNFIRVTNSVGTEEDEVQSCFNYTYVAEGEIQYDYSVKASISTDTAQLLLTLNGKVYTVEQIVEDEKTYIAVTVVDAESGIETTNKYERVTTTDEEGNTTVSYVLVVEE